MDVRLVPRPNYLTGLGGRGPAPGFTGQSFASVLSARPPFPLMRRGGFAGSHLPSQGSRVWAGLSGLSAAIPWASNAR